MCVIVSKCIWIDVDECVLMQEIKTKMIYKQEDYATSSDCESNCIWIAKMAPMFSKGFVVRRMHFSNFYP